MKLALSVNTCFDDTKNRLYVMTRILRRIWMSLFKNDQVTIVYIMTMCFFVFFLFVLVLFPPDVTVMLTWS